MNKTSCVRVLSLSLLTAVGMFAQSVPAAYQDLYNTLTTQIQTFDNTVQAGWNKSSYPTSFAPQLQSASSDEYTRLLNANYMSSIVLPQLQLLQALGATGVTVHIDFPILYQPFYVSNPSQYQQFVNFYQQLALAVHSRGMKLIVESAVGEPLPGNNAASFSAYYASLSWNQYMQFRAQNAVNVAQLIQPDYISVIIEPDTEAFTTTQTNAGTPSGSLQLLQTILTAMQAGGVTNVKVGAGAGTWTQNYTQYLQNYCSTAVDFVDMHIYPVNGNDFLEALSAADTIHAAGKPVGMSEAWPWKVRDSELGSLSYVAISARDPFSFWGPIDASFLQAIVDFSQYKQLAFISPFWTDYFFSYVNYSVYGSYTSSALLPAALSASDAAVATGTLTPTAHTWENRIIPAPDTTAPVVPAAPVATVTGMTGFNLAWSPTADNVGTAGFKLYRNGTLIATTTGYVWYDQNLVSGATYSYTLTAFDASGNVSAPSAPLTVTTINITPPPAPTGLTVTGVTSRTVSLSWKPSTDISGIAGYRILKGTSPTSLSITSNVSGTTTTFTDNCRPSSTFYYAVESFIPTGISSVPSSQVTATTPAH